LRRNREQSAGKTFRKISDAVLTELTNEANRALFGVGRAFHIGRLTVVDAECYEAMGAAFNNFSRLQGALEGVAEMAPNSQHAGEDGEHCVVHWGAQPRDGHAGEGRPEAAFSGADVVE
jgi:hypothetical protein